MYGELPKRFCLYVLYLLVFATLKIKIDVLTFATGSHDCLMGILILYYF